MVYRRGDKAIGIGNFPRNKRKCLYIQNGCVIRKVASFTSDRDAEIFEQWLEFFLGLSDLEEINNGEELL